MWAEMIGKSEYTFELILIESILSIYFSRKSHFALRFLSGILICFGITWISIIRTFTMWGSIPLVIFTFLLTLGMMIFCYEERFWKILFVGVAAFLSQSIIYSLFIMNIIAFSMEDRPLAKGVLYCFILLVILPILYFFFARKLRYEEGVTVDHRILTLFVLIAGIIDTVFKFYMIDHGLGEGAGGVFLVWKGFSMLACIFILCTQFSILSRRSLAAERDQLEQLLYQQQKQFENTRENIEVINIKCHDLKHWLHRLKELQTTGQELDFAQEAEEMGKALAIYDSTIRTGNETLDTILTEKKLRCEYNRIHMTCIADGEKLNALSIAETCSLFGNIIDNAIEAVSQVEEESKRTISLVVRPMGDLLSIHEENYYAGELQTTQDGFTTTKADKSYHGFGLKSIRMITEKYHGVLSITAENGIFNMNILLPLKAQE